MAFTWYSSHNSHALSMATRSDMDWSSLYKRLAGMLGRFYLSPLLKLDRRTLSESADSLILFL